MKIEEREVVIVGSGPAGALTAALLAREGHDVLLLDKQNFPRIKICGDAIPGQVITILEDAGLLDKVDTAVKRGEFYHLRQMRIVSPGGHQLISDLPESIGGYRSIVAPRYYFDLMIQSYAINAGAEFRNIRVTAPLIENEKVNGVVIAKKNKTETIRAKILIAADGVNSVLARALRINKRHDDRHRALALRAYIENFDVNPHQFEFFLYKNILPGYAWIFPLGANRANIGLGMRLDHYLKASRKLKVRLEDFLAIPEINSRLKKGWHLNNVASWPLNFGSQKYLQYSFNGALLIGDAAGFVNPLSGGGIHRSLLSAQLAASTARKALLRNDCSLKMLGEYEALCKIHLLKSLRRSYYLQKVLFQFPYLIDFFIGRSKSDSMLIKAITSKL